jgi:hypothetical protein
MKKILGLDLGTNSIGWALVNEAENSEEKSSIVQLGVRVNPLTVDEQQNFENQFYIYIYRQKKPHRVCRAIVKNHFGL